MKYEVPEICFYLSRSFFGFRSVSFAIELINMLFKSIENIFTFEAKDKTAIKEIIHPKNDGVPLNYSLAHASLKAGESSLPHCLVNQFELYFFLSGSGRVIVNDEVRAVKNGDVVLVPKGARQYVENQGNEPMEMLCIVSPPWREDEDLLL